MTGPGGETIFAHLVEPGPGGEPNSQVIEEGGVLASGVYVAGSSQLSHRQRRAAESNRCGLV